MGREAFLVRKGRQARTTKNAPFETERWKRGSVFACQPMRKVMRAFVKS